MKRIITIMFSAMILTSVLTGCNVDNDNEINEQPEDVNYEPTRNNEGDNLNNNRGPNIDTEPRNVREPNEPDIPNNMDEEEPDLDEEPSEEKRGY
ncbi:hypothetical protein [Gracilibacillus dipsosauri]|uniref:Lipoprotein n=1 Tax=Gracilibacillus dipsosauri TaxID=178340 RepID=A0A317L2J5_9BACI|nr:hypothetical protein [Gracilibacillus dipsosauri]PWU69230.1 hypothetical protein DLJ74_04375 [Gracilibacillus dipsosauri]